MAQNLPAKWEPSAPCPLDEMELVHLAREIAIGIYSIPTILERWRLTEAQYSTIQATPFYVKVLENEQKAWESTLNTEKRTQLKALAMFEDLMPALYPRLLPDKGENLRDVIEGAKLIAKVAGVGEKTGSQSALGEKFQITINLGEDQKLHFVKDITPPAESDSPEGSGLSVPAFPEGA